jgi:hypothetical protein
MVGVSVALLLAGAAVLVITRRRMHRDDVS